MHPSLPTVPFSIQVLIKVSKLRGALLHPTTAEECTTEIGDFSASQMSAQDVNPTGLCLIESNTFLSVQIA